MVLCDDSSDEELAKKTIKTVTTQKNPKMEDDDEEEEVAAKKTKKKAKKSAKVDASAEEKPLQNPGSKATKDKKRKKPQAAPAKDAQAGDHDRPDKILDEKLLADMVSAEKKRDYQTLLKLAKMLLNKAQTAYNKHGEQGEQGKKMKASGQQNQPNQDSLQLQVKVSNLPWDNTKDEEVRKCFVDSCGSIASLAVRRKPNGKCTGQAIVQLKTLEAVEQALSCHGKDIGGMSIRVERRGEFRTKAPEAEAKSIKRKADEVEDAQVPKEETPVKKKKKKALEP